MVSVKCLASWLAVLSTVGCATGTDVAVRVRTWTGPSAIACGYVAPGANAAAADSCALSAYERGVPFWVRYGGCGCDAASETVFLRAVDGGPRWHLAESECSPLVLQVAPGQHRLTCFDERVAGKPGVGLDQARCALKSPP